MTNIWNTTSCSACPSLAACRTQIVVATPCKENGLLILGEAPGADEDKKGEGFVGAAGKTLDRLLLAHGIDRECYGRANICRCRPPENRKPTATEIANCVPFLANLIEEKKPKVILAVGGTPTAVLCGKGSLHSKILQRHALNDWTPRPGIDDAHEGIKRVLASVPFIVMTPHTSPLAFNRNAPSGEKWALVAERQIAIAVGLLRT